jgi:hypothetical protein
MHAQKLTLFLVLSLLLFSQCKKDEMSGTTTNPMTGGTGENGGTPTTNSGLPIITPTGDERYLNEDSDYIFDQESLHTFQLIIPEDNLAILDADPAAEEYVEGMLIFEGDTISPVGVRYKGSVGAYVNCLSGTDWANPSGYKTCTKLSMKVKINWEGREEKFYKLKKLQFHSQNNDESQFHDRLGYWLFRQMGVPGPRAVHAKMMINGDYVGLFSLVEQIDGRFAKYNFDDDEGNLYKEIWPLNMNGNAHNAQTYLNGLKTNEDENPSVDIIKNFAEAIANAPQEDVPNIIQQSMNIDEIMSYIAVDRTIRHDDGPFHWYCNGNNGCGSHNFYWYEEPTSEQLHLIPWDLDNTFENIIFPANPVTPIADDWGEISNNCEPFSHGIWGLQQWSATCDKLTGGWATFTQEYEDKKAILINGPMSETQTDQLLNEWMEQIRDATMEAADTHNDAISLSEWENAVQKLKSQLNFARNN